MSTWKENGGKFCILKQVAYHQSIQLAREIGSAQH
jgi:hypothetical protein